jgi:hypothetical protein
MKHKKRFFMLLLTLLIVPLAACKTTKIALEAQEGILEPVTLTYDEVQGKKTAEHDFVLYYYLNGCSACAAFTPVLQEYIEQNGVIIYRYPFTNNATALDTIFGPKVPDVVPTLLFIVDGKLQSSLSYSSKNSNKFLESEAFSTFMDSKVTYPSIAWISREALAQKIGNQESFVIYFSLQNCGDCARFDQEFVHAYMEEYKGSNRLYKIETYPWRQYKGNPDPLLAQQWIDFAEEFQLYFNYQDGTGSIPEVTIDNYSTYGDSGKIPTIQAYNQGELVDMMVYYNDKFSSGDWPRSVVGSYFSNGPIGQTFENYAAYTSSSTVLAFYNQKARQFFDQHL